MNPWLIRNFFKKLSRSPKVSGMQLLIYLSGSVVLLAILFFVSININGQIAVYFSDPAEISVAVILGFALLDLMVRLRLARSSFAEYAYYVLPIKKGGYALQTVVLSHINILNIASIIFLVMYWQQINASSGQTHQLIQLSLILISTNNFLAVICKRSKTASLILLAVALILTLWFGKGLLLFLADLTLPQMILGWVLVAMALALTVYFTYSEEAEHVDKSAAMRFNMGLKLKDPILWQEVMLIIRNKRPRGLLLSYFLIPLYFLFILHDSLAGEQGSNFAVFFFLYFIIAGFAMQYGYLGLSWESNHFEGLLVRTSFSRMLKAKYNLLTVMNIVGFGAALGALFIKAAFLPTIIGLTFFQFGLGTPFILYLMIFNDKRIEPNKSSFFNYQGVSATQMFGPLLVIIFPLVIYVTMLFFAGNLIATAMMGVIGIVAIILRDNILSRLEKIWLKKKYHLIDNYRNT